MRKNRGVILFTAIVLVALSVFCAKIMKKGKPQTLTVTDKDGITYLAVYDQNSNVYAGITDLNGDLYAARIDEIGEVVLDEAMYAVENYSGTLPTNNTTAIDIQQTNPTDYNYLNVDVSKVNEETVSSTNNTTVSNPGNGTDNNTSTDIDNNTEPGTNNNPQSTTESPSEAPSEEKTYLADKYIKLFESGTYYMSFSTDDPELPGDIQTAFKNGNIYMDTTVEGIACKVVYRKSDNTGFIVIPSMRMYCVLPDEVMSEMATGSINLNGYYDVSAVDEFSAVLGERTCQCEEYTYEDGSKRTYYFYNGSLVRIDIIESDGTASIYNINSISSDVDDSLFEKPKGLVKLNLSWLNMDSFGR